MRARPGMGAPSHVLLTIAIVKVTVIVIHRHLFPYCYVAFCRDSPTFARYHTVWTPLTSDRWQPPWIEGEPRGLDPRLDGDPPAWIALAVSLVVLALIAISTRR